MARCFQLYKKGNNVAADLEAVDLSICEHFGLIVDKVNWALGWYNNIGFWIAAGKGNLGDIRLREFILDLYSEDKSILDDMIAVLTYLESEYESAYFGC